MHMTSTQWIAGSLVSLVAAAGAAVSGPWAERTFAQPEMVASDAANATHTRTCITIGGKKFEWTSANVPFGTLSCSQ
jgi:hypothetical protein